MARRDRRGRGSRGIQCFLLDSLAYVGVASRSRHAGSCSEMGTMKAGAGPATGALVACLLVGRILAPVARRWRMPFAAIGFASVVSMMPGVFLFRTASGLVQLANNFNASFDLLRATIADAMTAITVILAMSFGVVAPKMISDCHVSGFRLRGTGSAPCFLGKSRSAKGHPACLERERRQ